MHLNGPWPSSNINLKNKHINFKLKNSLYVDFVNSVLKQLDVGTYIEVQTKTSDIDLYALRGIRELHILAFLVTY